MKQTVFSLCRAARKKKRMTINYSKMTASSCLNPHMQGILRPFRCQRDQDTVQQPRLTLSCELGDTDPVSCRKANFDCSSQRRTPLKEVTFSTACTRSSKWSTPSDERSLTKLITRSPRLLSVGGYSPTCLSLLVKQDSGRCRRWLLKFCNVFHYGLSTDRYAAIQIASQLFLLLFGHTGLSH